MGGSHITGELLTDFLLCHFVDLELLNCSIT
jgi:hypothetical protein